MTINNLIFDHTQRCVDDAIQGMAFHELMKECDRNWVLLVEEHKSAGKYGGPTSETVELILKALPDNLTKEEVAVLSAFTMFSIMQKSNEMRDADPLSSLLKMLKDDLGKLGKDLE